MKVKRKQRNSKMCFICGLDNPYGVKAQFYVMEDNSVVTLFKFKKEHQSYPERVHGGIITAMLDELGLRAFWIDKDDELGVTMTLETKYRKPIPYDLILKGRAKVIMSNSKFIKSEAEILDMNGNVLANATIKYLRMENNQVTENADMHEEMCYLIEDDIKEIS